MTSVTSPAAATPVPFRRLAATFGPAFLALGFLARLPTAMLPLGVLLLVSDRTGSFGLAGAAVAAMSIGGVAGGLAIGRLADRFGHRRTGLVAGGLSVLGLLVLVGTADRGAGTPVLLVVAAALGLVNPQIGSMARSRWVHAGAQRPDRTGLVPAAMGYESAADETSFVLGPVLVGSLAVLDPSWGLIAAAGLTLVGQTGFAVHRSAVPGRPAAHRHVPVRLPWRRVLPIAAVVGCVGLVFGASQTGVAARLELTGQGAWTGPVYGCLGVGSAVSALISARVLQRWALQTRVLASAAGLVVTTAALSLVDGAMGTAVACLAVGLTVAPVLVSAYALVDGVVPPGRSATVMALLATATTAGVAVGAAVTGALTDRVGPGPALLVGAGAGLAALVLARGLPRPSQDRG